MLSNERLIRDRRLGFSHYYRKIPLHFLVFIVPALCVLEAKYATYITYAHKKELFLPLGHWIKQREEYHHRLELEQEGQRIEEQDAGRS